METAEAAQVAEAMDAPRDLEPYIRDAVARNNARALESDSDDLGMSLREYMATEILVGLISKHIEPHPATTTPAQMALMAVTQADALIQSLSENDPPT